MTILLVIAIAIVAVFLIGVVLIQQSKGGGFGMAFGGIGETVFGAHAASHLVRVTVTLVVAFFVLIIGMALWVAHGKSGNIEELAAQRAEELAAAARDSMPVLQSVPGKKDIVDTATFAPIADTKAN